jgi:hypothetical protein
MNKVPILRLYLTAFNEGQSKFFYNSNNVILDIKDTFLYWPPIDKNLLDSWNRDHLYLYELQVPPDDASGLYKIMRADLEKVFNLRGSIETRKMDCMVLVRTSDKDAIASSGKERKTYFKNASSDSIQCFQNIPFESFFAILKYRFKYAELPLVDATGYRENIDIAVSAVTIDAADYTVLKNDLKKYDLDLVKMKWDVDVLVLKEIDSKKQNK